LQESKGTGGPPEGQGKKRLRKELYRRYWPAKKKGGYSYAGKKRPATSVASEKNHQADGGGWLSLRGREEGKSQGIGENKKSYRVPGLAGSLISEKFEKGGVRN